MAESSVESSSRITPSRLEAISPTCTNTRRKRWRTRRRKRHAKPTDYWSLLIYAFSLPFLWRNLFYIKGAFRVSHLDAAGTIILLLLFFMSDRIIIPILYTVIGIMFTIH